MHVTNLKLLSSEEGTTVAGAVTRVDSVDGTWGRGVDWESERGDKQWQAS